MDKEVRGEFEKIGRLLAEQQRESAGEHQKTRAMVSAVEERLSKHLIDAGIEAYKVAELVAESKGHRRWFWSMVAGTILALSGAVFAVVFKVR